MNDTILKRLESLRTAMKSAGVDAVIIPRTDPHQSEYLAERWHTVRWLSGFTGSAATMVVTATEALLWTDSRYFLQAAMQLEGTTIVLMKGGLKETPEIEEYLIDKLSVGDTVGIDGMLFSINSTRNLQRRLNTAGIGLSTTFNPIDAMWLDRPALPQAPIFIHEVEYAGESAESKIARVRAEAEVQGAKSVFIGDLAEIAWTLNIRCCDVECNPVATAFLLIGHERSVLFIDPAKVTADVARYLDGIGVDVERYDAAAAKLAEVKECDTPVLLSASQVAGAFLTILDDKAIVGTSPVAMLKAVKNDVQIAGMRHAMERDGAALVKSFIEIERRLRVGEKLTEMGVAEILLKERSKQPLFYEESFETIAGYGEHGAIVHYEATPETDAEIYPRGILLIDSGASYLDGTTDITRTITLGDTTPEQKHDFTLVLKGMIDLSMAIYPEGTRGVQLDVLARRYLWNEGLTYLHGTGHGVGHFLNVHEGPQSIRLNDTFAPLLPGMITSDEPGLYRTGLWGIRCENLVLTTDAMETEFGRFLKFETLTLFPFDLNLLDTAIMTREEIDWLNDYHAMVYDRLAPLLDENEKAWLKEKTRKID